MSATFIMKIKDLQAETVLGVFDWEKRAKRIVILNIELHIHSSKAGDSDDMQDAVDYAMLEENVINRLEASHYNLIERLVTDIGQLILSLDKRIAKVTVEADKPGALRVARSVSVSALFNQHNS